MFKALFENRSVASKSAVRFVIITQNGVSCFRKIYYFKAKT